MSVTAINMQLAEDGVLLDKVCGGDRSAFDVLYQKYWKHVYNAAYKRLNNHDNAKDIAQDVFTQLWISLAVKESSSPIENLAGYLYTAVRNNVLKSIEKDKKFIAVPDLLLNLESFRDHADAEILYHELERSYRAVIDKMPQQQRVIFKMRYEDELTSDAIANELQISPKTVRNQLGKALIKLKTSLFFVLIGHFIG
jgi:RNA polymerase sigma-70 factor (family 1)